MRILYGVVGEGLGHAIRSRVVLEELVKRHQVHVVVSGRAHDFLLKTMGDRLGVTRIWGWSLAYKNNAVDARETALYNLRGALGGVPRNVRAYFEVVGRFAPELVISDFESWSTVFAHLHGLPVVSIDNMQSIARCRHPRDVYRGLQAEYSMIRAIVNIKVPGAVHYHIATFFYPPVTARKTTLHPPILRPEILGARTSEGEHLLVYQTSTSHTALPGLLKAAGIPCRVYGLRRDLTADVADGPLLYRPFSERTFIDDLASARGVIANGGFTLMGEAVYLRRPMLALPIAKQFEQTFNARYLERAGYGMCAEVLTRERLLEFMRRLPELRRNLEGYTQDGNTHLFAGLERTLATIAQRG